MITFSDLLTCHESQRDSEWENNFLSQFAQQKVAIESEDIQLGPDHWPYLFAQSEGEASQEATEPVLQVIDWLSDKGVGLAFNAQKPIPDYIFTYGMIWHFGEMGLFRLSAEAHTPPPQLLPDLATWARNHIWAPPVWIISPTMCGKSSWSFSPTKDGKTDLAGSSSAWIRNTTIYAFP